MLMLNSLLCSRSFQGRIILLCPLASRMSRKTLFALLVHRWGRILRKLKDEYVRRVGTSGAIHFFHPPATLEGETLEGRFGLSLC